MRRDPRGIVANVLDCDIVESEVIHRSLVVNVLDCDIVAIKFEFQSSPFVHF